MDSLLDVSRFEVKYGISQLESFLMQKRLSLVLPMDTNNHGFSGYMVRSLYFDSAADKDYEQKLAGLEYRKKIRIRIYAPHSETAKLELKEKLGKWQRKRSIGLSRDAAELMIKGDFSPLEKMGGALAEQLYTTMTMEIYRPRTIVQYKRTAFMLPTNDTRITFDSQIEATESDFDLFSDKIAFYPAYDLSGVVLEVKYNGFIFSYVSDAISAVGTMPSSYSKYVMARKYSHMLGC